jgi:hypothetical protein
LFRLEPIYPALRFLARSQKGGECVESVRQNEPYALGKAAPHRIDLLTFSDLVFYRVQPSTTRYDKMKTPSIFLFLASTMIGVTPAVLSAAEEETGQTVTVKGEVIDMACYAESGASGKDHADCAKTCISAGLPVGLKSEDGKIYLLIGDHKPMNNELANYAAQTITVKGKAVSRDGVNMIENAEIIK